MLQKEVGSMRTSTAQQLELSGLELEQPPLNRGTSPRVSAVEGANGAFSVTNSTTATLSIPDFGSPNYWQAITSRLAGRINAAHIPQSEQNSLLRERQELLDKVFDGTISRKESHRLQYVRWSLDRIEDARHGAELDKLDDAVRMYEQFILDVKSLTDQLAPQTGRRK
jgi:hypothetical protein